MNNHKATKSAFNGGPLSARQRNAISMAQWRFADRPIIARFKWSLEPRSPKKLIRVGHPLTKLSGSAHACKTICTVCRDKNNLQQVRIQRGMGIGGPDPPEKSQDILVSIGNKQLDPPGKSWTPWKMLDPLWSLEFEIDHLTSVK